MESASNKAMQVVIHRLLCAIMLIYASNVLQAQGETSAKKQGLTNLNLEDLMNLEVTSVAKKPLPLSRSGAAVYVLQSEDIRRSGALSVPELLRMVPGLEVAQVNANQWAISSRGFNSRFANKLLVLVDGRSVYTPLFSGVYWESLDTVLEDIDRIEVIRGPGGTLWGANAVNGVINIITKKSSETQGGLASSGFGTEEQGFGTFRYGGHLNNDATYRVYGKYLNHDSNLNGHDDWRMGRGGFRTDWKMYEVNQFTVEGEYYQGDFGQGTSTPILTSPFSRTLDEDIDSAGGNILSRWRHEFNPDSDCSLQMSMDRTYRSSALLRETRHTVDLDWQHRVQVGSINELLWGAGYRFTSDDTRGSFELSLDSPDRDNQLFSSFIQDQITIVEDRLWVTPGTKLEHNDFTGFEVQPGIRSVYSPSKAHSIWAAISKAVRTPSRIEANSRINDTVSAGPTVVRLQGSRQVDSENLLAYECGYRVEATRSLTFDTSFFYNEYDHLFTVERGPAFIETTPPPTHAVVPFVASNKMTGETYGTEISAHFQATPEWTLMSAYTYLEMNLHRQANSSDTVRESLETQSPRHQFFIQSRLDLPNNIEFDQNFRFVSSLASIKVPSYFTIDSRIAWRPREELEVSFVGQNLLDESHPEFVTSVIESQSTEVERSFYGKVTWRF